MEESVSTCRSITAGNHMGGMSPIEMAQDSMWARATFSYAQAFQKGLVPQIGVSDWSEKEGSIQQGTEWARSRAVDWLV